MDKMKRIRCVGLCLVAMFAFSAMVASAAQAAEVKGCAKAVEVRIKYKNGMGEEKEGKITEGKYKNESCSEPAENTGKYPPYSGPEGKYESGPPGVRFNTRSGEGLKKPKLAMEGWIVQCKLSAGKGEWTGAKTGVETVVFRGCELNTNQALCTSEGSAAGEIKISPLELTLIGHGESLEQFYYGKDNEVIAQHPNEPVAAPEEAWVESSVAAGHTYYTQYACGTLSFRTLGTVAGRVETALNTVTTKTRWDVGPGQGIEDLYSEYSEDGGSTWAPVGGATEESYEAATCVALEVVEPG